MHRIKIRYHLGKVEGGDRWGFRNTFYVPGTLLVADGAPGPGRLAERIRKVRAGRESSVQRSVP